MVQGGNGTAPGLGALRGCPGEGAHTYIRTYAYTYTVAHVLTCTQELGSSAQRKAEREAATRDGRRTQRGAQRPSRLLPSRRGLSAAGGAGTAGCCSPACPCPCPGPPLGRRHRGARPSSLRSSPPAPAGPGPSGRFPAPRTGPSPSAPRSSGVRSPHARTPRSLPLWPDYISRQSPLRTAPLPPSPCCAGMPGAVVRPLDSVSQSAARRARNMGGHRKFRFPSTERWAWRGGVQVRGGAAPRVRPGPAGGRRRQKGDGGGGGRPGSGGTGCGFAWGGPRALPCSRPERRSGAVSGVPGRVLGRRGSR